MHDEQRAELLFGTLFFMLSYLFFMLSYLMDWIDAISDKPMASSNIVF